jgi:hypothetical protein
MSLRQSLLRVLIIAGLTSAPAAGCTHSVTAFGNDDDDCESPKPPSDGWCPPAWTCVDGEWIDTAGACPDPCPADRPGEGSSCDVPGALCEYEEYWYGDCESAEESTTVSMQCTADGWTTIGWHCSPPIECPDEPPIAGTDCSGWYDAYYCSYEVPSACGTLWMNAYCEWNGEAEVWSASVDESCELGCGGFADAAGCEASSACRWLEPGCDAGSLEVAGCFDADPCGPETCDAGATCTTVGHDPCWNQSCNSCSAETAVCLETA